jgi:hypothetical protein
MSNRKYPRIGGQRKIKPQKGQKKQLKTPVCIACINPSTHRVELQVNWFRGDDETVNACDKCKDDPVVLLIAFDARESAKATGETA